MACTAFFNIIATLKKGKGEFFKVVWLFLSKIVEMHFYAVTSGVGSTDVIKID